MAFDIKNCQAKLWPLGHILSQLKSKLLRVDASPEISPNKVDMVSEALALALQISSFIAFFFTYEARL